MGTLFPKIFDMTSIRNQRFIKSREALKFIKSCQPLMRDYPFESFYKEFKMPSNFHIDEMNKTKSSPMSPVVPLVPTNAPLVPQKTEPVNAFPHASDPKKPVSSL